MYEPNYSEFKKYRKKPIVVEVKQMDQVFKVKTLEGNMSGKKGDYLVIGIKGEQYPVDKDIFEESYEEVKTMKYSELDAKLKEIEEDKVEVDLMIVLLIKIYKKGFKHQIE